MSLLLGAITAASLITNVVLSKKLQRNKKSLSRAKKTINTYKNKTKFFSKLCKNTELDLNKLEKEMHSKDMEIMTAQLEIDNMKKTMSMLEDIIKRDRQDVEDIRIKNMCLENEIFKYIGQIKESRISMGKCYF